MIRSVLLVTGCALAAGGLGYWLICRWAPGYCEREWHRVRFGRLTTERDWEPGGGQPY